jgi:hypothetical protein
MRFTTDQVIEMNMRLLESAQIIWVIKLNIVKLRSLDCSNICLQRSLEFLWHWELESLPSWLCCVCGHPIPFKDFSRVPWSWRWRWRGIRWWDSSKEGFDVNPTFCYIGLCNESSYKPCIAYKWWFCLCRIRAYISELVIIVGPTNHCPWENMRVGCVLIPPNVTPCTAVSLVVKRHGGSPVMYLLGKFVAEPRNIAHV